MKGEFYNIPMGMTEQGIVTTIELFFPDLLLAFSPGNSSIFSDIDEASEKYGQFEKVMEIDIDDEETQVLNEMKSLLEAKQEKEEEIFSQLESVFSEAVDKIQNEPHIHMPTPGETSQILGNFQTDDDDFLGDSSNLII